VIVDLEAIVNTGLIVLVVAVAVLIIGLLAWLMTRRRRSAVLQQHFGSEYERRLEETGDRKTVETELRDVSKRRRTLDIAPLSGPARDRYAQQWRAIQSRFVDQPDQAVTEADLLVAAVMRERGYPVDDFDDQIDMVAVDHPDVAENYRAAHEIHERNAERLASTDDLRQALIHYRSLFEELLAATGPSSTSSTSTH